MREAGEARVLGITHARGVDLAIQGLIPRRALPHFRGARSEVRGKILGARGASRGEQSRTHHDDGIAVGPREALARRFTPRQPSESGVLLRRQGHRRRLGELQAEKMLGVVRHARREAVPPLRIDFEGIRHVPASQAAIGGLDAGLLAQFAGRRVFERLVRVIERPGDRLPEARPLRRARGATPPFRRYARPPAPRAEASRLSEKRRQRQRAFRIDEDREEWLAAFRPGFGARAQYVDQHAEVVARLRLFDQQHVRWRFAPGKVGEAILQRVPVVAEPVREAERRPR